VLDVFPRHRTTRYWGDVTRTVVRGEPSKKLEEQYAAVLAAQENALSKVRAGTSGDEVHREVIAEFERRGFGRVTTKKGVFGFTHGTGHSVGLDLHEEPRISTGGATLEAGNAVTVEPGLYYPTTGGVRIEDLVIVRKNGCQNITRLGKEDWIL
jgi:Xaa-Pro aminopeptidase